MGFGAIHGVTLGFGITLIGESVDYSIYFFIQSRQARADGAAGGSWQQRWWPTIRLGMLTSVCGFASLLPSGFPGLKQLGLYSISGLIAAAFVTRFILPALLPLNLTVRDVTPLGRRVARLLQAVHGFGRAAILWCGAVLVMLRTAWDKKPLPRKSFRNSLAIGLAATVAGAILYVVLGVRIGIIDFSGPPRGRLASFYRNKGCLFEREAKSLSPNHGTEVT